MVGDGVAVGVAVTVRVAWAVIVASFGVSVIVGEGVVVIVGRLAAVGIAAVDAVGRAASRVKPTQAKIPRTSRNAAPPHPALGGLYSRWVGSSPGPW